MSGVLLDVDGTLIDSNDAHARSWVQAFREFGYSIPFDLVRPLIGMGGDKLLPRLTGLDHDSSQAKRLSSRRGELFLTQYLPTLRAFPRAREFVDRMHDAGLVLVIATSAKEQELNALLEQAGLESLIPKRTTSDDAKESKPDPDIVHAALERGHLSPDAAILVGDTPYDVEAARRAGVSAIAVRCGGWDDRALSGAAAIYEDVADLERRFESSPIQTLVGSMVPPR